MTDLETLLADANPVNDDDLAPSFDDLWHRFQRQPPSHAVKGRRLRYGVPGGLGVAAVLAAVLVLFVVPGGSSVRPTSAAAAVLARAASAVGQPNTIFYVQVEDYNANGPRLECVAALGLCDNAPPATAQTGISANPDADTLTYSFRQWASPDGNEVHTIYSNGNEVTRNTTSDTYEGYDAAENTLTTVSDVPYPGTPQTALSTLASKVFDGSLIPFIENPSYYQQLLQDAETSTQGGDASGWTTISAQLVGQTTIAGDPVYELRFDVRRTALPEQQILLYIDTQTFLPVRSVGTVFNVKDFAGAPPGMAVSDVADYSIQNLPDTPANQALLQMTPHPDATQVQATYAQYIGASHQPQPSSSTTATGATGTSERTGTTGTSN